jgi:hypothetical protein
MLFSQARKRDVVNIATATKVARVDGFGQGCRHPARLG